MRVMLDTNAYSGFKRGSIEIVEAIGAATSVKRRVHGSIPPAPKATPEQGMPPAPWLGLSIAAASASFQASDGRFFGYESTSP
ncbi:MAG: hypothetical protein NT080_09155 [Spirochaetes bacterium]|nr:hypothetical protein [Spirochaetota bacterium]